MYVVSCYSLTWDRTEFVLVVINDEKLLLIVVIVLVVVVFVVLVLVVHISSVYLNYMYKMVHTAYKEYNIVTV